MRLARIFGLAFLTGFSGAIMPGPLLAMTIGQVSLQGFGAVPLIMLGHALLELLVVGLLITGLVAALRRPAPRGIIAVGGGAALVYMGVDMVRSAGAVGEAAQAQQALSWGKLIFAGAAISMSNPYFLGWWATIGVGGMAQMAPRTAGEYLSFYGGHELADFAWYGLVGALLVGGQQLLGGRGHQVLIVICGVAVVVLGLWFLWTGIQVLRGRSPAAPSGNLTTEGRSDP